MPLTAKDYFALYRSIDQNLPTNVSNLIKAINTRNVTKEIVDALFVLAPMRVVSTSDTDPPASTPTEGTVYVVGSSQPATGDWAGNEKKIAIWSDNQWQFIEPSDRMRVIEINTLADKIFAFKGTFPAGNWEEDQSTSEPTFQNDLVVTLLGGKSWGQYVNGDTIPATGKTAREVIAMAVEEFLPPSFNNSFVMAGQPTTVEVGTTVLGIKTFNWSTSNPSNVEPNTIAIDDITDSTNLATGLANDGTEDLPIGTIKKTSEESHKWRITMEDTQGANYTDDFDILWAYYIFYGPAASAPTNDTEARALPNGRYTNQGNVFILNTGTTESNRYVLLPPGLNITNVTDLTALGTDITGEYSNIGNVTVVDADGTNVTYAVWEMDDAIPYTENHEHRITVG